MHTISVSIYGSLKVTESVEVEDAEALPLFVKLKSVLQLEEAPKPIRRRGRPPAEKRTDDDSAIAQPPQADQVEN